MKSAIILAVFVLLSATALPATIYVPDDFGTIQGAIDAASNGNTIIVRPGTYVENIDFSAKAVTLMSEMGPTATVIDGNESGSVVTFQNGEMLDSVLDGFTVTNGKSTDGGGIYCAFSNPTIRGNIITANTAESFGGGIECVNSSPVILNNVITANSAILSGGGIGNWDSNPIITNSVISANAVTSGGGGGIGGGKSSPTIINSTIIANSALDGGGIYGHFSSLPTITNTILWENVAPTGPEISISNNTTLTISFSDLKGGQASCYVESDCTLNWGAGMITTDPLFVDLASGDLHLTWNSPCRDTGDNSAVNEPHDFEGDPRITLGNVDMGADEYYYHLYHMGIVTPGSPVLVKVIGGPTMPVFLGMGSGIQDPPMSTQYGDLYLTLPLANHWPLGNIPGKGVLEYPATIPTSWNPGEKKPFQALVGPFGGPWTQFTDLMVLMVD